MPKPGDVYAWDYNTAMGGCDIDVALIIDISSHATLAGRGNITYWITWNYSDESFSSVKVESMLMFRKRFTIKSGEFVTELET